MHHQQTSKSIIGPLRASNRIPQKNLASVIIPSQKHGTFNNTKTIRSEQSYTSNPYPSSKVVQQVLEKLHPLLWNDDVPLFLYWLPIFWNNMTSIPKQHLFKGLPSPPLTRNNSHAAWVWPRSRLCTSWNFANIDPSAQSKRFLTCLKRRPTGGFVETKLLWGTTKSWWGKLNLKL